jgi:MFS family permease
MRTVEFPILTISVGLAISIILGLTFIFWELRHPYPLIDLKLFLNPYLTLTVLIAFLTTLVLTGTIFLVPFYLDLVMSYSTELAGLIIFMATLIILVGGPLSGRLSDKFGAKKINILGVFIMLIALVFFTFFDQTVSLTFILIVLALRALSDGVSNPANSKLVISYSPPGMEYTVSSLLNAARYLGVVTGVVVFETVFNKSISQFGQALTSHGSIEKTLPVSALVHGFQTAFFIGVILTLFILILTFLGSAAPDKN